MSEEYNEYLSENIQFHLETRKKVEDILNRLRAKLAIERVIL